MLRHDHRIAALNKPVENPHQLVHIRRMQPRGGLVQQIERFTPLYALQLPGELNALAFAAGQFGGRLSQFQVSETKRGKRGQGALDGVIISEHLTVRSSTSAIVLLCQRTRSVSSL